MEYVLLSGGLGTRLRPLTLNCPKALVPLAGRPILDYVLERLEPLGFTFVFAVGRLHDMVENYVRFRWGHLDYVFHVEDDEVGLGTGGALKNCEESITGRFFVGHADVITSVDPMVLLSFHVRRGGIASISIYYSETPHMYGVVELDGGGDGDVMGKGCGGVDGGAGGKWTVWGRIRGFVEKPSPETLARGWINSGTGVFERDVLDLIPGGRRVSMEKEVFPLLLNRGFYARAFSGLFLDAGNLDSYLYSQRVLCEMGMNGDGEWDSLRRVFIYPGARVEEGAVVENSAVFTGARVEEGAVVKNSILDTGCVISSGARVEHSIIGSGMRIEGGSGGGKEVKM